MNTWSVIDNYFKKDKSLDPSIFYHSFVESDLIEENSKPKLFNSQYLSQSQYAVITPATIQYDYLNLTGERRWVQPFIEEYSPIVRKENLNQPSWGWGTLVTTSYIQPQKQSFMPLALPTFNTKIEEKNDLKKELVQILNEFNFEVEEENMVIRNKLIDWFKKKGNNGVHTIVELLKERKTSEDKMSEILIALGCINDYSLIPARLELFDYFSIDESFDIRYGAVMGLSSLATPSIVPTLRKMKRSEAIPILKQIINSILKKYDSKT